MVKQKEMLTFSYILMSTVKTTIPQLFNRNKCYQNVMVFMDIATDTIDATTSTWLHTRVRAHTLAHRPTRAHTRTHPWKHAHTCRSTHRRAHTHSRAPMNAGAYAYASTRIQTSFKYSFSIFIFISIFPDFSRQLLCPSIRLKIV